MSPTGSRPEPSPWRFPTRGIAIRLFLTCWLVFVLHFATNIVREIYPALAIGDHLSFRVDEYGGMHPDLFEKEGYGWHIGNNPGISMLAAIPYAACRPIIDPIVTRVQEARLASGADPPPYDSPWPMAREFYAESWRRGFDVKFGLAAFVMHAFCMAPASALAVVVMFYLLRHLFRSDRTALLAALLYAFGTPVFFRTGFLNHNLMLGQIVFMGFIALWNPTDSNRFSEKTRLFLGGLAGGTAFLFDYSGVVLLGCLFLYALLTQIKLQSPARVVRLSVIYGLGALGPVLLLWFYQWQSFGHPFYPGQHWMPPVEWIELGYQGYGLPQAELMALLTFDYRFGLFTSCPLFLLAVASPFVLRGAALPRAEHFFIIALAVVLVVFFSGSNYTRLQFNTGIRYLTPLFPFLFVPTALVLARLPSLAITVVVVLSAIQQWCFAMYRDVELGLGLLEPIVQVFAGGPRLPAVTTLSRMGANYGLQIPSLPTTLSLFGVAALLLYGLWHPRSRTLMAGR